MVELKLILAEYKDNKLHTVILQKHYCLASYSFILLTFVFSILLNIIVSKFKILKPIQSVYNSF